MRRDEKYVLEGDAPLPVDKRPKCKWCGKPLKPHFDTHWDRATRATPESVRMIPKTFSGRYGYDGLFCREAHGAWWAAHTIKQIQLGELVLIRKQPKKGATA